MRKFAVAATAAALALALAGCARQSQETPPDSSVSANADQPAEASTANALDAEGTFGDISYMYPSSWIIDVDTDEKLALASPDRDKIISAVCFEIPGSSTLVSQNPDEYRSVLEALAESAASSARDGGMPLNIRGYTIGELEGIRFEFEGGEGSFSYTASSIAFILNDTLYSFSIANTTGEPDALDESILDSLRINKNTVQANSTDKKPGTTESESKSDSEVSAESPESNIENRAEEATSVSDSENQAESQEEPSEPEFLASQRDLMKQASLAYKESVPNDMTGNWRLAFSNEGIPTIDYVIAYYKEHFASDKEVHAIVNYNLGTITRLNYGSGLLFVDTYEYRSGEEADAKSMFEGEKLDEIVLNAETGEALQ